MKAKSEALEPISWSEAKQIGQRWYFIGTPCRLGHVAKRSVANRDCRHCVDARRKAKPETSRAKDKRRNGTEKRKASSRASYQRNIEKRHEADRARYAGEANDRKARALKWGRANPEKRRKLTAQARRYIKQATPRWLSIAQRAEIAATYADAAHREGEWQVDHIVPLRGRHVRGLHVPWNLRVITGAANRKKGNRHET